MSNVTGVPVLSILLTITSGSINVKTDVVSDSYSGASAAEAALAPISGNSTAATSIFGVQVESMSDVSLSTTQPPPAMPPPQPIDPVVVSVLVGVTVLVVAALAVLGVLLYRRLYPSDVQKKAVEAAGAPLLGIPPK